MELTYVDRKMVKLMMGYLMHSATAQRNEASGLLLGIFLEAKKTF
jgi:hypothetical protein